MISSGSSNKIRASKSTRNLDLDETDDSDGSQFNRLKVRGRGEVLPSEDRYQSTLAFSTKDGRGKPRTRTTTEFRPIRMDRRGTGPRARGAFALRADREAPETSYRLQESLTKNNAGDFTTYHFSNSKYYDRDSKIVCNLPEDPRISKLLRRLCAETEIEKSLVICSKLQDAIMLPDNERYIRRSYDILVESLLDVLYDAPGPETQKAAATVLGRIGFVMGPDYNKHLDWLIYKMPHHSDDIKSFLVSSILETFQLDKETLSLMDYAPDTMTHIQSVMEGTDSPKIFMSAVKAMIVLADQYPEAFAKHFVDIVDILVGWHVDGTQSKEVKEFALYSLHKMSRHWQADPSFSINLLSQFIEDMVAYGTVREQGAPSFVQEPDVSKGECIHRVTSFMNVFNTVAKSLGNLLNPNVSNNVQWSFLSESFTKVLKILTKFLEHFTDDDLLLAGNECVYIFLGHLQSKLSSTSSLLYALISLEITKHLQSNESTIGSILNIICKTIKEVSGNLPLEFIQTTIGPCSPLRSLRFSCSKQVVQAMVGVYTNLLNLKNIPLLQEAYKCVLMDMQLAYKVLLPTIEIIPEDHTEFPIALAQSNAESLTIFYLQCLSELANASNSIIGMWALQPSILELLAVRMQPFNSVLLESYPMVQFSVLYLLYSHCKKNTHFIASSDLVSNGQHRANVCDILGLANLNMGEVSTSGPTSRHFNTILNLFSNLMFEKLPGETLLLALNWVLDILHQLDKYLPIVHQSKVFVLLIDNIIKAGTNCDKDVVMSVANNLLRIMKAKNVSWNNELLNKITCLCLLHIDQNDTEQSNIFSALLCHIPWDIVVNEIDKLHYTKYESLRNSQYIIKSNNSKMNCLKDHFTKGSFGEISGHHFKILMNFLLNSNIETRHQAMNDCFMSYWPLNSPENCSLHLKFFRYNAMNFASISTSWFISESAQLCINLKLRTPLGKPQETFTSIESALKCMAREFTTSDHKIEVPFGADKTPGIKLEQIRSRWLIELMEYLEKYIYNAAEGTATVLLPVPKQVRTFFHTNRSTCREWLNRVRPASLAVSLHSGHSAAAIRHAQSLLLTASSGASNIDIEAITVSIARALIKLQEPEVLHGLYVWIKRTFDIKMTWLKAAAEQANLRIEVSVDYYQKVITSMQDGVDDTRQNKFISEQVVECYKNVQDWKQLQEWKDHEKSSSNCADWSQFDSLRKFEDGDIVSSEALNDWNILQLKNDETPRSIISYNNVLNKIESSLFHVAMNLYYNPDNVCEYSTTLGDCVSLLNGALKEFTRNTSVEFMKEVYILHMAAVNLKEIICEGREIINPFQSSVDKLNIKNTDLDILGKIMWWNQYFAKLNVTEENTFYVECMRLEFLKSARKHGNVLLARRQLEKYFNNNQSLSVFIGKDSSQLGDIVEVFMNSTNSYDFDIWSLNNSAAFTEMSKLLYLSEESRETAINLCASVSLGVSQRLAMGQESYHLREKGTRMLLTLSKWVQNENDHILTNNLHSPLTKLVTALPEIGLVNNNISANVIPISDSAVGKLLQFSVNQCPSLAKAWSSFGAWCFRWGRKMVEYSSQTGGQLTDTDKMQIQNVMTGCTSQDFELVCEILSKTKASCDDEDIDWNEINTSEMIENQLRSIPSLVNAFPEHLACLVDIWRQAQKRVFSYYELSADAYFKFLQLNCSSENITHSGEYAAVTATLRLLRLVVKHAMELQTVLETGLANTPTQPWKVIIPQLFSRLNHPETYVRRCVSELLCRLAEDAPHLITFPAVVGAVENEQIDLSDISFPKSSSDVTEGNDNEPVDLQSDTDSEKVPNNELNCCFLDMVETLSKQAPETILQVQLLVKELQRINLLWDELWIGTLTQHHTEFSRRLSQLDVEVAKVKNNINLTSDDKTKLINEKHRIIFQPIIFVLEQLNDLTSGVAETPHEISFQEKFQPFIKDVIHKLNNPTNPGKPQESWLPIKQLQIKLQQKTNKRVSYILKMSDISPVLAQMRNSVISMPGVQTSHNTRITIQSIENNVAILPTKTKPKKLVFHGSDGKAYTYLFKGLEDLHLDERIMQFLSISNTMMARNNEDDANQTYRARHYSVVPLGPRSGLISWVDNVTPLFALYKRWQHREATIQSVKTNKTINVLRPSELFYNKLTPLLQAADIKSSDNRKEWPIGVLKQVLVELMNETPNDLLEKELWCGSVSPDHWWQTVRRYSYSMAVMSTIGYIIGLGDRHLDNVLVDLTSGEVVHIDYNVCFEKGKSLRVPEKVPFRLTPNLVNALGVTGVEGIFRITCEHVLKVMKRGRETLLTLLEAFVYDPLVEWGSGGGGAGVSCAPGDAARARDKRRELEIQGAVDMLAVRCTEMRHDWNENRDEMLTVLPEIRKHAETWLTKQRNLSTLEQRLQDCHRQIALIEDVNAYGANLRNHPLYAISQTYTTYKQTKNALGDSMKGLKKILDDSVKRIDDHVIALDAITGPQLTQWIQEYSYPNDQDNVNVFDSIKEFLMNAGQVSMISQCEQSEAEITQCIQQQGHLLKTCLDLLSQYAAIVQYYPQSYIEHHRTVLYRKWATILLETKSPDVCRDVIAEFNTILAPENPNSPVVKQVVGFNYQLQTIYGEANNKLNKAYQKLQNEGGSDTSVIEKNYDDAKNNLSNFLRLDKGASAALECVIIKSLCTLNRRYLKLEAGAQSAGDCLVDLTSRDGDWFLDDMHMISSVVVELTSLLTVQHVGSSNDDKIAIVMKCLKTANFIFKDLQDLNFNFQTIILPEALKKIQAEDPSVLLMINELNNVVLSAPCPLNDLLEQLEMNLRYLIMEIESPPNSAQLLVADFRSRYEALFRSGRNDANADEAEQRTSNVPESAGRMVLMGFDGLFASLNLHGAELMEMVGSLEIPAMWKKVDQIREAKDMSTPLHSVGVRSVLADICFIRRVQAVTVVFSMCVQMSCAFKGVGPATVFDEERICKPVRRLMADYVRGGLVGVHSTLAGLATCRLLQRQGLDLRAHIEQKEIGASWKVPLEELCEKGAESCMKAGKFTANVLAHAATLLSSLENAVRRRETACMLERAVTARRVGARCLRLRWSAHAWLHEDAVGAGGAAGPGGACTRATLMAELRRVSAALAKGDAALAAAVARQAALVASAQQRLKWASGANPALRSPLARLLGWWEAREARACSLRAGAARGGHAAQALLRHEAQRTRTQDALHADARFLAAANHHVKACNLAAKCTLTVQPTEEALMELLHPDGVIDVQWVQNVSALLSNITQQIEDEISEVKVQSVSATEDLEGGLERLRGLKGAHARLAQDAKGLLKTLAKTHAGVADYLARQRGWLEALGGLAGGMAGGARGAQACVERCAELQEQTPAIYDDMLKMELYVGMAGSEGEQRGALARQGAAGKAGGAQGAGGGSAGGGRQQQNAHAAGVWKRVRLKLEGRERDPARRQTTQEQVEYMISEATSIDNLCLMYEGWMAWV